MKEILERHEGDIYTTQPNRALKKNCFFFVLFSLIRIFAKANSKVHKDINDRIMKRIGIILGILALLLQGCITQQEKAERRAKTRQAVEQAVGSKQLHIDIKSMSTLRYGSRMVTPDFYLELRGDTLRSYLPYLGQAQQSPMVSPSIGLNFEEPILQYKESRPKAKYTQMEIDVKTREDSYHYTIDVFETGEASIRVRSQNRDPISFDGCVSL